MTIIDLIGEFLKERYDYIAIWDHISSLEIRYWIRNGEDLDFIIHDISMAIGSSSKVVLQSCYPTHNSHPMFFNICDPNFLEDLAAELERRGVSFKGEGIKDGSGFS